MHQGRGEQVGVVAGERREQVAPAAGELDVVLHHPEVVGA
jgi:hypothetical protein